MSRGEDEARRLLATTSKIRFLHAVSLPHDVATFFAVVDHLALGELSGPVSNRPGSPGATRLETGCKRIAVRYIDRARAGEIDDPRPINTVVEAFGGANPWDGGIATRTIHRWKAGPELAGEELSAETVTRLLPVAGQLWSARFSKRAQSASQADGAAGGTRAERRPPVDSRPHAGTRAGDR